MGDLDINGTIILRRVLGDDTETYVFIKHEIFTKAELLLAFQKGPFSMKLMHGNIFISFFLS